MSHLSDGALRRLHDEPLAMAESHRDHLTSCLRCQGRYDAVTAAAGAAAAILAVESPRPDVSQALGRLRQSAVGISPARPAWYHRLAAAIQVNPSRLSRPAMAGALAVGLSGTLVLTGAAQNALNFFEPKQVQSVGVSLDALSGLPDLTSFGSMHTEGHPTLSLAGNRGDAAATSGLNVLAPTSLPSQVTGTPTWRVMNSFSASFTVDLVKAQAAAVAAGKALPTPPAGLDGSTLTLDAGPAVLETFGEKAAKAGGEGGASSFRGIPMLAVVQMRSPRVTSTNVTVVQLEDYIASFPGVSKSLAAAIRAIGDPSNTLPIPVPIDKATSTNVQVQGVTGILIGDNSGLGSALIWVKGGEVYAVLGTLSQGDVQAVADSLK